MQNVARELAAEEYDHVAFFQNSLGSAATPVKPKVRALSCANPLPNPNSNPYDKPVANAECYPDQEQSQLRRHARRAQGAGG